MPRVNRGAIGGRLLLVGGVAHRVVELAVLIRTPRGRSKVEFADSVADTITDVVTKICRALGITGIRRRGHPDADETHSYRGCDEPNSFGASVPAPTLPCGKVCQTPRVGALMGSSP